MYAGSQRMMDPTRSSARKARRESYRLESRDGPAQKDYGIKEPKVTEEVYEGDGSKTRPANHRNWESAFFDVVIAILALYFVVFAILAYTQNGTPVGSYMNSVILRLAGFNPTVFPILFTLIVSNFIKAIANWKLEQGATVGTVQHLLGSRTLVASILTPIKLGTTNLIVIAVIVVWLLNPLGGQTALRVASRDSNYTTVDTNFHYLDFNTSPFKLLDAPNRLSPINSAFITALFSPTSSKNGTQDMFGNLQVPMLEVLRDNQLADSNGWYKTSSLANQTGKSATKLKEWLEIPDDADNPSKDLTAPYIALTGIPFLRGGLVPQIADTAVRNDTNTTDMMETTLAWVEGELLGLESNTVVNTESHFNIETSYFYTDCSVRKTGEDDFNPYLTNHRGMSSKDGYVSNNYGLWMDYNTNHTFNSTEQARVLTLNSWSYGNKSITAATCNLTTTYVEASVYCANNNNCSVEAIRPSTLDHPSPNLSQLDGIAPSWNKTSNATKHAIPELFFSAFINATGNITQNTYGLQPIECYFVNPEAPYTCSVADRGQFALYTIGDLLFSQRFTQLLNTYWMDNVAQCSVTGNFTLNNIWEQSESATTPGQIRVETTVLRCRIPFMIVLICISTFLFAMGLATAYLDATRKGPDVFDDFVNSLRHNPYVHVEQGPSMEDGSEKVRRMRNTVIRMGDVKPDDPYGYVAIGTPNEWQPVRPLTHERRYR